MWPIGLPKLSSLPQDRAGEALGSVFNPEATLIAGTAAGLSGSTTDGKQIENGSGSLARSIA